MRSTSQGWWIGRPVELPGSRPLRLEHGNIGSQLIDWPREHVVKCLVFYHPYDVAELRRVISEVYRGCCKSGYELLLDVILPESNADKDEGYYLEMLQHFYLLGIKLDWWKLPPLSAENWQQVGALIDANDPFCRGVLILGQDASEEMLKASFAAAAEARWVKDFAVGRTIFGQLSRRWLQGELDDAALIEQVKQKYLTLIGFWRQYRPTPHQH